MTRAFIVAAALALLAPASASAQALPDGSTIKEPGPADVYRIVGGAPLWINDCGYAPGCPNTQIVANLDDYLRYPRDGTLARQHDTDGVYRFVNGTPLWLSHCGNTPNCGAVAIVVDRDSLTDPRHVRLVPPDGTVVENVDDGGKYRFAGGAPLLVRCDLGAGCVNSVQVDSGTFGALGSHRLPPKMRQYPADGTVVQTIEDGAFYRFAGNAALPLSSCDGCAAVSIDALTLRLAGTATAAVPHIAAAPAEGTYLTTGTSTYRIAGGAALQLKDCTPLGGCTGAVTVDAGTIAGLGGGRLLAVPKDGTVLRALPSKRTWEIVGGKRQETFIAGLGGIEVDDGALDFIPVDATPAPREVFKPVISSGYKVFRTYTRFTSLKVRDALPGSVVTVSCAGKRKGCPFKKAKQYRLKGTTLNVYSRWFKKAKLKTRSTVTVRVTSPSGARKQQVFKIRSRKLPVRTTQCSVAGAKFSRCS